MRVSGLLLISVAFFAFSARAQDISVTIEKIVPNEIISGKVTGLPPAERESYKVVVYVKTDQWYIHPFASGGDGRSYASVTATGDWRIQTVQREFPAERMAAIVVRRSDVVPERAQSIAAIRSVALAVRELRGTPDYGGL
jgi:hypothetical protein